MGRKPNALSARVFVGAIAQRGIPAVSLPGMHMPSRHLVLPLVSAKGYPHVFALTGLQCPRAYVGGYPRGAHVINRPVVVRRIEEDARGPVTPCHAVTRDARPIAACHPHVAKPCREGG